MKEVIRVIRELAVMFETLRGSVDLQEARDVAGRCLFDARRVGGQDAASAANMMADKVIGAMSLAETLRPQMVDCAAKIEELTDVLTDSELVGMDAVERALAKGTAKTEAAPAWVKVTIGTATGEVERMVSIADIDTDAPGDELVACLDEDGNRTHEIPRSQAQMLCGFPTPDHDEEEILQLESEAAELIHQQERTVVECHLLDGETATVTVVMCEATPDGWEPLEEEGAVLANSWFRHEIDDGHWMDVINPADPDGEVRIFVKGMSIDADGWRVILKGERDEQAVGAD